MFVGAHPDDETYCAGGLLYLAAKRGQRVVCVTATRGEKGVQDTKRWPTAQLAQIRSNELQAALHELGVREHLWLGCKDGGCKNCPGGECCLKLTDIIKEIKPDSILTFGSDGLTGHADHCQVSQWVDEAVDQSGMAPAVYHAVLTPAAYTVFARLNDKHNVLYDSSVPVVVEQASCDLYHDLDDDAQKAKMRALKAMPSQTEALLGACTSHDLQTLIGSEAFMRAR